MLRNHNKTRFINTTHPVFFLMLEIKTGKSFLTPKKLPTQHQLNTELSMNQFGQTHELYEFSQIEAFLKRIRIMINRAR
jgi:hypothetical protein